MDEPILRLEGQTIEHPIVSIPLPDVDIVDGEHETLAKQPVVDQEEGPIEDLQLVVPEYVEDLWPGSDCVPQEPQIIGEHTDNLAYQRCICRDVATQVEHRRQRRLTQLGRFQEITSDEVELYALTEQAKGEAERVRAIAAARQDRYFGVGSFLTGGLQDVLPE
jgi:hypothetical protein